MTSGLTNYEIRYTKDNQKHGLEIYHEMMKSQSLRTPLGTVPILPHHVGAVGGEGGLRASKNNKQVQYKGKSFREKMIMIEVGGMRFRNRDVVILLLWSLSRRREEFILFANYVGFFNFINEFETPEL